MRRFAPAAVLLSLLAFPALVELSTPAHAELAAGRVAFDAADYKTALAELAPVARQGDPDAALLMGRMAENGWGMPRNEGVAWGFYKQAADRGLVEALLLAAEFADLGRGTPIDRHQAYVYYTRAAEAGNPRARGHMGEMAVHGRGRKVNMAEGINWLRQAAEGDDPEAYALLDELAAKGRIAALPAGSAEPGEVPARRVLAELRGLFGSGGGAGSGLWLSVGGEITTITRPDGSVLVTVPDVVLEGPSGKTKQGTQRLIFRDIAEDSAKVEVLLPTHWLMEAKDGSALGSVSLSGQRMSGLWSFSLHTLGSYRMSAASVGVDIFKMIGLTAQGVGFEQKLDDKGAGHYTAAFAASTGHLAFHVDWSGRRMVAVDAAGLAYHTETRDIDLAGYRRWAEGQGVDWRLGSPGLAPLLARLGNSALPPIAREDEQSLVLDGLTVESGGKAALGLKHGEYSLVLSDLDKPLASGHLTFAQDGLEMPSMPPLRQVAGGLTVQRLPIAAIGDYLGGKGGDYAEGARKSPVAAAATPPLDRGAWLNQAFTANGTTLRLDELAMAGDGWSLQAGGKLQPGPTVGGEAVVHGLDAVLAASARQFDRSAAAALRAAAKPGADDKGEPVSVYQLALPPGGGWLANGQKLGF